MPKDTPKPASAEGAKKGKSSQANAQMGLSPNLQPKALTKGLASQPSYALALKATARPSLVVMLSILHTNFATSKIQVT
jgi:hypothetical protein